MAGPIAALTLRSGVPADLDAVVAIQLSARAPLAEIGLVEILGLPPIAEPLFVRALIQDGVAIGVADGRDVGFGMFERLSDGVARLHQISVVPDAGRRGFGRGSSSTWSHAPPLWDVAR